MPEAVMTERQAGRLEDMHEEMLRIRRFEEEVASRYPEQEMRCPTHLSVGQEAVAVGVSSTLRDRDYVFSNHRSHAHYLAKGGDPVSLAAELYGRVDGCTGGRGGSMHLVDLDVGFLGAVPIVSATIPLAVGAGLRAAQGGEDRVAVIYLGEGATEEGAFHESMNFACLKELPVIFVCENNLYSVYSPLEVRQPESRDNLALARSYGAEAFRGDGNEVLEVRDLAGQAVRRALDGGGPTFLELETYRWREHCGPYYDNDLGYRSEEEFREWRERCPIDRARRQLLEFDKVSEEVLEKKEERIEAEVQQCFKQAKESPWPQPASLTEKIYSEPIGDGPDFPGGL